MGNLSQPRTRKQAIWAISAQSMKQIPASARAPYKGDRWRFAFASERRGHSQFVGDLLRGLGPSPRTQALFKLPTPRTADDELADSPGALGCLRPT
jgi:hypothetical protein